MVVRPSTLTYLLYALCGQDTVTAVPAQAGAFQHVYTPFTPAAGVDLPWMTLIKDAAKLYAEQYLNTKLQSLRLDVPKSSLVTAQASWFATTPSSVTSASLGAEIFDTTQPFVSCNAVISLTPQGSGSNISANSIKMERYGMTFGNNISNDEFSVGSFYPDDVTLLQRTAMVDMDLIVRDTALYQAVYLNGNSIPASWSPTIYRGSLTITLTSTQMITGTTQPYQLIINFPGLDFMTLPISIVGANLVRATLSTQVTLGPSGSDMYTITLINGTGASY